MKTDALAASLTEIAGRGPSEALGEASRYVIVADLRMGDGGKKDELAGSKKALMSIFGRWYLPEGYTLVLNGDIEDLRNFWIKDIVAAWPELYALFDAFAERGRLWKIVGERDLSLLRLRSYPYELLHGLRLDGDKNSILVTHGHQASPPFVGRDYLSDCIRPWLGSSRPSMSKGKGLGEWERYKAERRLYRAASRIGMATITGHTLRPLFESFTRRDFVIREVERLFDKNPQGGDEGVVDALIDLCRREAKRRASDPRVSLSGPGYDDRERASPCLFCPGRIAGVRGLRVIEIAGGALRFARWAKADRESTRPLSGYRIGSGPPKSAPLPLEGTPYVRIESRSAAIRDILDRVEAFASDHDTVGSEVRED